MEIGHLGATMANQAQRCHHATPTELGDIISAAFYKHGAPNGAFQPGTILSLTADLKDLGSRRGFPDSRSSR